MQQINTLTLWSYTTFLRSPYKSYTWYVQVPQLQEMSDALTAATGWRIRPVAGLMHPRHFLAGLAFK